MKLNIFLENLMPNKNKGIWRGKRFWIGLVSLLDGRIEEVHTYEEAEAWDFHHSMYFSQQSKDKLDNYEADLFFIDYDGEINLLWHNEITKEKGAEIETAIEKQIKLIDLE